MVLVSAKTATSIEASLFIENAPKTGGGPSRSHRCRDEIPGHEHGLLERLGYPKAQRSSLQHCRRVTVIAAGVPGAAGIPCRVFGGRESPGD
jgi:hypothetical protein